MIDDDLWNQWACDPDKPYHLKPKCTEDRDYVGIAMACALFILLCVLCAYLCYAYPSSETESDSEDVPTTVYEQLDAYGGTIRLAEATGRDSSLSLVTWYVPIESGIQIQNGYLHVDKAKSWIYDTDTVNIFIPLSAILYVTVNSA